MGAGRVTFTVNRQAERFLADLGGARSPELVSAAKVLVSSIRRTIRAKSPEPSTPGQPPVSKTGALRKSVVRGVVGSGQRVAVAAFYAPLLEFGVDTRMDLVSTIRSRRDLFTGAARTILRDSFRKQLGRARRRALIAAGRLTGRERHMRLLPRPFMAPALAAVQDQMLDVAVSEIRRRTPTT